MPEPVPTREIKYLDPREFIEGGYLHEINRLVLHPLGLALEFTASEHSASAVVRIWDDRDDPEGTYLGGDLLSREKAIKVCDELLARRDARMQRLGWIIQPFPDDRVLTTNYTAPELRSRGRSKE
jgi:hypothetical protein